MNLTFGLPTWCLQATLRLISWRVSRRSKPASIVVMTGGAESDNFNALVLTAGLMWRDVVFGAHDRALLASDTLFLFRKAI